MKPATSSVSGFTMTELMVVVAIAGILAAIAAPSFRSLIQSQQVKNASFDLFSSLSLARSEAIKRNSNVTVTPVTYPVTSPSAHDEYGWVIVALNNPSTSTDDTTIRNQSQEKGVDLRPDPNNSPWVTYKGNGRATTAPVFTIDAYGETTSYARCVKIELSGMPRVYMATNGVC